MNFKVNLNGNVRILFIQVQDQSEDDSLNAKRRCPYDIRGEKEERKIRILKEALVMGNIHKGAKKNGVSGSVIRKWRKQFAHLPEIKECNQLYQQNRCSSEKYNNAQKKKILLELKKGSPKQTVAFKYRIHPTTLRKWEKKFGKELGFKEFMDVNNGGENEEEFEEDEEFDEEEASQQSGEERDEEDGEEGEDGDDEEDGEEAELEIDAVDVDIEDDEIHNEESKVIKQIQMKDEEDSQVEFQQQHKAQEKKLIDSKQPHNLRTLIIKFKKIQTGQSQFSEVNENKRYSCLDVDEQESHEYSNSKDVSKSNSRNQRNQINNKEEDTGDNGISKRKTRSVQKGVNDDNDQNEVESDQFGLKHLVVMKIENYEQLNLQSENGWFIFAADSLGIIRVYTIKKGQTKYSLYSTLVSQDKSEIYKMRYIQFTDELNYIIVLKESRIEIWEWPKRQLYDFVTLQHKALDIAQYNYKNQTLYGVLETNRTKNQVEISLIELMQFEQNQATDPNVNLIANQSQKYNGKVIIKNTFTISCQTQPSSVQCIKILDEQTQEKPKYVVTFDHYLYILDHTGQIILTFEFDKDQEVRFIEPINNTERDRNYSVDLLCASSKGWLYYISLRQNKILHKKFLENTPIQSLRIKYLQKGEFLIAVALPHCIRFILGEKLKDIHKYTISNDGEICQNGFNIIPINDPKNKMKIHTVYSPGKFIEAYPFLTNNFL